MPVQLWLHTKLFVFVVSVQCDCIHFVCERLQRCDERSARVCRFFVWVLCSCVHILRSERETQWMRWECVLKRKEMRCFYYCTQGWRSEWNFGWKNTFCWSLNISRIRYSVYAYTLYAQIICQFVHFRIRHGLHSSGKANTKKAYVCARDQQTKHGAWSRQLINMLTAQCCWCGVALRCVGLMYGRMQCTTAKLHLHPVLTRFIGLAG